MIFNFKFCLVVATLACFAHLSTNLCAAAPANDQTEFEKQLETLFEKANDNVEQEELIEQVNGVRKAYLAPENEKYRRDHSDMLKVLDGVLEAAKNGTDKCWVGQMYELTTVVETAKKLQELNKSAALMDFIKQLANEQFNQCRSSWGAAFQRNALAVDKRTKSEVDSLIAAIASAKVFESDADDGPSDEDEDDDEDDDETSLSSGEDFQHSFSQFAAIDEQFISGLVSFVRDHHLGFSSDSEMEAKVGAGEEFEAQFQTYFDDLCSPLETRLTEYADIYFSFLGDGMAAQDDEFARDWVTRVELCRTIRNNLDQISEEARPALLEHSAQQ